MRILVDGAVLEVEPGENLLVALLRRDLHPTGGGCLCMGGDCPHCLASVDGVSYVRTCQSVTRPDLVVDRDHLRTTVLGSTVPPVPDRPPPEGADGRRVPEPARHIHSDVVVIGMGAAGRAEAERAREQGREVVALEARQGREAVGIYAGPLVVARSPEEILLVHPREEIVVATGAAEIQPVAPGSELAGLVTARAAGELAAAGVELGRLVAIGEQPIGVGVQAVDGELVRFEGEGRVDAVVIRDESGVARRHRCDTVSLGLGLHPRDTLYRMGRDLPGVRVVGDAALEPDLPPCPRAGTVCACTGVEVNDLQSVWERGFRELELVKRATLAGTGTCQGSGCIPHVRSFLLDRGREVQPPFTARPVTRQVTIGEMAAGAWHRPTLRTPLHEEHLRLGARMERTGGWWRPWSYGDPADEYAAVRRRVSLGDVSTLGKLVVSGPDSEALLDLVYPTRIETLPPGRTRYSLLLDERGYVLDDGLVCRDSETRFTLTLTSAGWSLGELWLRDWAESGGFDVRILNQTMSLGAINVTGPRAAELLARAGVPAGDLPGFARHGRARVAGVDCRIFRLSFTGELSYELHHAAAGSATLWRRLLHLGRDLGVAPHGMATLLDLRLEKGHIVVGQDTDYDSTPRRLDHTWAVDVDKPDFIGRQAVRRTDAVPLDRQLVGLEMESPAPAEGAVIRHHDAYAGQVTSSADSAVLGRAVMLGWLHFFDGALPEEVTIDGRSARRVPTPFYDPEGKRARASVSAPPHGPADHPEVDTRSDEVGRSTDHPDLKRPASLPAVRTTEVDTRSGETGESVGSAGHREGEGDTGGTTAGRDAGRFKVVEGTRVVATPAALEAAAWPAATPVLRIAEDEALVLAEVTADRVDDPHAIVERETGFSSAWFDAERAAELLARTCAWNLPAQRPALAQGSVADVPVKLWIEDERVLLLVPSALAADLEERLLPAERTQGASTGRARTGRAGTQRAGPGGAGSAANELIERQISLRWPEPKASYDVVIVGGGGHGLATAYYLATRHGITDVAVLERSYIGGGNSGRNTTVIRANYGIPEAVRFYQHSMDLYGTLGEETGRDVMHRQKGLLWIAHSELGVRAERGRAEINVEFGTRTEYVEPEEIARICPQIDLSGGGVWPVRGATYHPQGASARHDRVVWAYAEGAMRRGVHVHQRTTVRGLTLEGDRIVGVETDRGPIGAGTVVGAVGGHVTALGRMAGLRLPIRTHPLQAFVTNHYQQTLGPIVASSDLLFYAQQTPRGEILMGAEIDRQPSYSYRSGHPFLQYCAFRATTLLPFLRDLRVLRQWTGVCDMSPDYSPIMSATPIEGFYLTTGWGTWGFKAIPAGGEQMADLIATGEPGELIAPFSLDRFTRDRTLADRGSTGTH